MFWDELDVTRWGLAVADQVAALETGMQEAHGELFEDAQLAAVSGDEGRDAALRQTRRLLRLDATALMLTVSLNHLGTALRAHPELDVGDQELFDRARVLRNVFEHWDETRGNFAQPDEQAQRSVRTYKAEHPAQRPWQLSFTGDDYVVGGIIRLSEVEALISELEGALGFALR